MTLRQGTAGSYVKTTLYAPLVTVTATTHTIQATDGWSHHRFTHASGCTVTVPPDLAVENGTPFTFRNQSFNPSTFVAGSGVAINTTSALVLPAVQHARLVKVGANEYDLEFLEADLAAIAGLTSAADRVPYYTGAGTAALATFTAAGRALIDDADAAAQRTTLGLGAAAVLGAAQVLAFVVDGGGVLLTTGAKKAYCTVPFACTITSWNILADVSGSIVFDIWKDTYANYPPVVADTITASAKPTVTTATKATSSTLTGWTTSIAAGDILEINIDSVTTITKARLELIVTRTG